MNTILFLDIDGVMNCELLYHEQHQWDKFKPSYWFNKLVSKIKWVLNGFKYKSYSLGDIANRPDPPFESRLNTFRKQTCQKRLGWLDSLCKEMNIKIVISSVWRTNFSIKEWTEAFKQLGFQNLNVIGVTETRRTLRGNEIKDWINKYGPVENYVIIDDDSDFLEDQKEHFFQTDPYSGLTPTTLYKIKRFLNGESKAARKVVIGYNAFKHSYEEHMKLFDGKVKFTFEQYHDFWLKHETGAAYKMKNRNGSTVDCKIAYYPLPYYDDLRAMIEIPIKDGIDFRDIPVHFLQKVES